MQVHRDVVATLIRAGRKDLAHAASAWMIGGARKSTYSNIKIPKTVKEWLLYDFKDAPKKMHDIVRMTLSDIETRAGPKFSASQIDSLYRDALHDVMSLFEGYRGIGATDTAVRDVVWGVFQAHCLKQFALRLGM